MDKALSGCETFLLEARSVFGTKAHPTSLNLRVVFEETHEPGVVRLERIVVERQKKGTGTRAMAKIAAMADRHGVMLVLNVASSSSAPGLFREKLKTWYSRFGFDVVRDGWGLEMRRSAQVPKTVSRPSCKAAPAP